MFVTQSVGRALIVVICCIASVFVSTFLIAFALASILDSTAGIWVMQNLSSYVRLAGILLIGIGGTFGI